MNRPKVEQGTRGTCVCTDMVRVRVGAWMSQYREQSQVGRFTPRVRVRVRVGAWMSQHREQSQVGRFTPRPHFIVITVAQRAHYISESETACRVNVLKLVSPNQPDSQQLWGQSTSKPNALILHEQAPLVGYSCEPRHQLSWLGS